MTLTVSVTSRQQENNLLNMIAAFLTVSNLLLFWHKQKHALHVSL